MKIEICIHCHNYQHRLCWMLSSLVQQEGDVPEIVVNVSHENNNGDPSTEDVISFFQKEGLNVKSTLVESEMARNRSIARNEQLNLTDADWIIFADADMVYSSRFFEALAKEVETDGFKNEEKCIGADRVSLDIPFSVDFFNNDINEYPLLIENVGDVVSKWPVFRTGGKNVAAGYFQLANVKLLRDRELEYPLKGRDGFRTYKADRAFRCITGGRVGMDLPPQYHLNHDRVNDNLQR